MKYYFITYQAKNRDGSLSIWNQVISTSPMDFIKNVEKIEENGANNYYDFVVINTCKISKEDYNEFQYSF